MMGNWDLQGCRGRRDLSGLQERTETRERRENLARRAVKETKEMLGPSDLLEAKDHWANQDCQVQMASQVLEGSRA